MIEAYWILGGMAAVAAVASLLGYVLARRHPGSPAIENLNARVRSWWVLIVVGGAAMLLGTIAILVLFAGLSFQALREFLKADRPVRWLCFYVLLPLQYVLIGAGWSGAFAIWIPVGGLIGIAVVGLINGTERFLDRVAVTQWGVMVCLFGLSHIPALMMLRIPGERSELLMVFVVLVAQVSDIMQYVWGKLIGQHAVVPMLSPSKTVEGLLGGVLSASLLGAVLWRITPFNIVQAGLMAFLISIFGFLGGLVMSAIKRDRGIKDWGGLLEGHGGILDRIDSLCFSAPVFFYATRYFFD